MTARSIAEHVLHNALEQHQDEVTSLDLLRAIRQQAELMYETAHVRDRLRADPFQHLKDIRSKVERLCHSLQVAEIHRTATLSGYSRIDATVCVPIFRPTKSKSKKARRSDNESHLHLTFCYERQAEYEQPTTVCPGQHAPTVSYSIDLGRGTGPKERLLWVQVWANSNKPNSHLKARDLDADEDEEEDGWEDISSEDEAGEDKQGSKRLRLDHNTGETDQPQSSSGHNQSSVKSNEDLETSHKQDAIENEQADRFTAAMDPSVLHQLLEWIDLESVDEATAFFLLMTFPFYELEWDIVGFVLESVFGYESNDESMDES